MLRILKRVVSSSQRSLLFLTSPYVECPARRWAGHSKWANIRHQKAANDAERNKQFTKLSRMIKIAIIEGKDPNPETNSRLQSVIGQCKRVNMPASTITNSIKSATAMKSEEKTGTLQVRGPGRCALLIEVATANLPHLKNQIASILKKYGCKYDNITYDFIEKGVLTARPLSSSSTLDDAMEHAIEASVEEVSLAEAGKLRFECSPEATWKAKKTLEEKGYVFDTVIVEHFPSNFVELSDEQLELTSKFLEKLEAMPEVMKITDNIA